MTAAWREEPLGAVCQFINRGISPAYLEHGGVAVLNQKCVRDHVVNFDLGRRHDAAAKKVTLDRFVRAGDVLVNSTGTGTLGRVAQLREEPPEPTTIDSHVTIVRPANGLFRPEFFGYALVAIEEKIQQGGEGCGGQTELSRSKLAETYRIRFPVDLKAQERIVAILDEAFEGIATAKANAEKNLQNARELFTHHREVMLAAQPGWREAPLAELCSIKHGYAFEGEFFSAAGEYVLLTPGSFFEAGGYRERGEKTKFFVGSIPKDYMLSEGDLLVAMTEQAAGLLGSPLLVPESHRFLHNQRLGLVVGQAGVPWSNEFFFHAFNLMRVRQEIHAGASGAKVRHTSPGKIGLVRVPYPESVDEQRRIAAQLVDLSEECDRLVATYERKLTALDELKKSLLHQAFSGQL
ncbi:MAG: hypothetical protein Q7T97_01875 [Burkholderiaceae bacterium]|nr:hypothetical protein [Burkholderiaceae bacterium]